MSYVFVVGNEKGGVGKTTCSMHLITSLLHLGYKVSSIDADVRQGSLSSYISNRVAYNLSNPDNSVMMPKHFSMHESCSGKLDDEKYCESVFLDYFEQASDCDYIVIDTPGSHTGYSSKIHSYADTIITPINDSFVDLDVIAKVDSKTAKYIEASFYSKMVWDQKISRASRDKKSIDWVLLRNRLGNLNSKNKTNVGKALVEIAKRMAFRIVPGFSERVIFRELFLHGLTLEDLDLNKLTISHVAARHELRNFVKALKINDKINDKSKACSNS